MYSAAIFYNPLIFGKLYALSETILNIDELYNTKRPSDLSDSFADKFNERKDNSLFCTIKTKVFNVKVLRNTLYIHFDNDPYINEYISRIFSCLLKTHGHYLEETKLHFAKYEYVPIEQVRNLNLFGFDVYYPEYDLDFSISRRINEVEKDLVIKTPSNKNKGDVCHVISKATCSENMLKSYSEESISDLLHVLKDLVNKPLIPGIFSL